MTFSPDPVFMAVLAWCWLVVPTFCIAWFVLLVMEATDPRRPGAGAAEGGA